MAGNRTFTTFSLVVRNEGRVYMVLGERQSEVRVESMVLGAVHMSRASPANRADSIISRPMVA